MQILVYKRIALVDTDVDGRFWKQSDAFVTVETLRVPAPYRARRTVLKGTELPLAKPDAHEDSSHPPTGWAGRVGVASRRRRPTASGSRRG